MNETGCHCSKFRQVTYTHTHTHTYIYTTCCLPNSIPFVYMCTYSHKICRGNALCPFPKSPLYAGLRVEDMKAVSAVVADMRKIIRQDPRIIQKLHRRVFLDKITREQVTLYVSFYVEAANRDAFMAIKQDLFLAFVDCVERNNAKLAKQRVQVRRSGAIFVAWFQRFGVVNRKCCVFLGCVHCLVVHL